MSPRDQRQPHHATLCKEFNGGRLEGCARPGLGALKAVDRDLVDNDSKASCSVNLDDCLKHDQNERGSARWDYIIVVRDGTKREGIGMEPHHADVDEVDKLIGKKKWAEEIIERDANALTMVSWVWLIPPGSKSYLPASSSANRKLYQCGIVGPIPRLAL